MQEIKEPRLKKDGTPWGKTGAKSGSHQERLTPLEKRAAFELVRREKEEPIRYFEPNEGAQTAFFQATRDYREVALLGGNKAGKTCVGAKYVAQAALGARAVLYEQEQIYGDGIDIWIGSVDYKVQRETNQPELQKWIPKKEVKKIYWMSNGVIDKIDLMNGSTIGFKTYDQGRKAWQGPVRDLIWHDEEAPGDIIEEARARLTRPGARFIFTMTPLLGFTQIYEDFVEDIKPWRKLLVASTYENKKHLTGEYFETMESMDEQTKQQRLFGQFVKLEGLVYSEFKRSVHVIRHIDPDIKRYVFLGGMDFGASHPTAFLIAGIDIDDNVYIFGEYKETGLGFDEYALGWKRLSTGYQTRRVFRDPSAKQAGIEMRRLGIKNIVPGINDRGAGINLIQSLLKSGKLFISTNCPELIYEFEHHRYQKLKAGQKDADVIKVDDDLLDCLKYMLAGANKMRPKEQKLFVSPVEAGKVASYKENW